MYKIVTIAPVQNNLAQRIIGFENMQEYWGKSETLPFVCNAKRKNSEFMDIKFSCKICFSQKFFFLKETYLENYLT